MTAFGVLYLVSLIFSIIALMSSGKTPGSLWMAFGVSQLVSGVALAVGAIA